MEMIDPVRKDERGRKEEGGRLEEW